MYGGRSKITILLHTHERGALVMAPLHELIILLSCMGWKV